MLTRKGPVAHHRDDDNNKKGKKARKEAAAGAPEVARFVAGFDPGEQERQKGPAAVNAAERTAAGMVALDGNEDEDEEREERYDEDVMEEGRGGEGGGRETGGNIRQRSAAAAFAQALPARGSDDEEDDDNDDVEWEEEDEAGDILLEDENVDVGVLASLPPELQKDVVESAKRRQRMLSRQAFMPVAGNPALYSQAQIANFLKSSRLNQKVMSLRGLNGEGEEGEGGRVGRKGGDSGDARGEELGSRKSVLMKDAFEEGEGGGGGGGKGSSRSMAQPRAGPPPRQRQDGMGGGGFLPEEEGEEMRDAAALGQGGNFLPASDEGEEKEGREEKREEGREGVSAADGHHCEVTASIAGIRETEKTDDAELKEVRGEGKKKNSPEQRLQKEGGSGEERKSAEQKWQENEDEALALAMKMSLEETEQKKRRNEVIELLEGNEEDEEVPRLMAAEAATATPAAAAAATATPAAAAAAAKDQEPTGLVLSLPDLPPQEEDMPLLGDFLAALAPDRPPTPPPPRPRWTGISSSSSSSSSSHRPSGSSTTSTSASHSTKKTDPSSSFSSSFLLSSSSSSSKVVVPTSQAYEHAIATASNLTIWAGNAVRRAIKQHVQSESTAGPAVAADGCPGGGRGGKKKEDAEGWRGGMPFLLGNEEEEKGEEKEDNDDGDDDVEWEADEKEEEEEEEKEEEEVATVVENEEKRQEGREAVEGAKINSITVDSRITALTGPAREIDRSPEEEKGQGAAGGPEAEARRAAEVAATAAAHQTKCLPSSSSSALVGTAAASAAGGTVKPSTIASEQVMELLDEDEDEQELDDMSMSVNTDGAVAAVAATTTTTSVAATAAAGSGGVSGVNRAVAYENSIIPREDREETNQPGDVLDAYASMKGYNGVALDDHGVAIGGGERREDAGEIDDDLLLGLEDEGTLKNRMRKELRDAEAVTQEMREDIMELLNLFGVPYLVAPMEAEAQCAVLERLGLVDGVVSDDSDSFLFGAKFVYKNIFDEKKYVEAFRAEDVERELGLRRVDLVSLALLLGSDYTEGVKGVGIVNATEVVRAFASGRSGEETGPPEEGLKHFRDWLDGFNPLDDLKEQAWKKKKRKKKKGGKGGKECENEEEGEEEFEDVEEEGKEEKKKKEPWVTEEVEAFHRKHKSARTRWIVDERFPDPAIYKAYLHPQVNRSTAEFTWDMPDLDRLRVYLARKLGWLVSETDEHLLPMLKRMGETVGIQRRLDSYFLSYKDNVTFAKIKSKRLREAVKELRGGGGSGGGGIGEEKEEEEEQKRGHRGGKKIEDAGGGGGEEGAEGESWKRNVGEKDKRGVRAGERDRGGKKVIDAKTWEKAAPKEKTTNRVKRGEGQVSYSSRSSSSSSSEEMKTERGLGEEGEGEEGREGGTEEIDTQVARVIGTWSSGRRRKVVVMDEEEEEEEEEEGEEKSEKYF